MAGDERDATTAVPFVFFCLFCAWRELVRSIFSLIDDTEGKLIFDFASVQRGYDGKVGFYDNATRSFANSEMFKLCGLPVKDIRAKARKQEYLNGLGRSAPVSQPPAEY